MSVALQASLWISPEEYLEGELVSPFRHEYIAGTVHAMSGASEPHNLITGNIYTALRQHLRGHRCRAYIQDLKVHLRVGEEDVFYYPDVFVVCDHSGGSKHVKEHPAIIFEVLSPGTERTDRREKLLAYQTIPSLESYILVEQERIGVTVFERAAQWRPRILSGKGESLSLRTIGFELSVERIYEESGLQFETGITGA